MLLEFVDEASEQLDSTERALLVLERTPSARGQVEAAMRSLHSIKGSAGYVSLFELQALCHGGEELLGPLSTCAAPAARQRLDLALDAVTIARSCLDEVRHGVEAGLEFAANPRVAAFLRRVEALGKARARE